jgi:hypothetical protein
MPGSNLAWLYVLWDDTEAGWLMYGIKPAVTVIAQAPGTWGKAAESGIAVVAAAVFGLYFLGLNSWGRAGSSRWHRPS